MATGTLTADGTEQVIDTLDPGVPGFVFWYVDLSNLDDGDEVIVRERIDLDGDGSYELFTGSKYAGPQNLPIINQSSNLLTLNNVPVRVTLEQTAGTNRDYAWGTGVKH
jgi:hypothetical protein